MVSDTALFKRPVKILKTCSLYPFIPAEITDTEIRIDDKVYPKDAWTNISETTLSRVGRKLHLEPRHPISIIRQLIEDHFANWTTFNDLHPVVTTKQNFDDLLVPKNHVVRNKSDNYYLNETTMLRAHTSAHQLDGLRSGADKFLISGDVFRRDEIDSSHYPVFHQMEGLVTFDRANVADQVQADLEATGMVQEAAKVQVVDDTTITPSNPIQSTHDPKDVEAVSAHLKYCINSLVSKLFADEPNLEVRWIEAYFPFTSPSWEVEIKYKGEWLEVLGCGVVQQPLLNNAGMQHEDRSHMAVIDQE